MKKKIATLCLSVLAFAGSAGNAQVTGFNDLATWTGSGTNQSALVIQWNDGKSPGALAWGFRWDTPGTTVSDMLLEVMDAAVGLFARGDLSTGFGPSYFGFGYDTGIDGTFGVTGATDPLGAPVNLVFANGLSNTNTNDASTQAPLTSIGTAPVDAQDRYREGWMDNGFWELYSGTGIAYPITWTASFIGAGETLAANGWYAFSISNADFSSNLPGAAFAAIPEPSTLALLAAGGILLVIHARKRFHAC